MIRTIVVDDEPYNLDEICDLVDQTGFMSVCVRCANAHDALAAVMSAAPESCPQAAFIDIEMPGMDGLTLAEKLLEFNSEMKIVFITGWNQYAVAAFELNALDYIMKPINPQRFSKMTERLKNQIALHSPAAVSTLKVSCFGKFEVFMDEKPVVWQRTKAEELFAYLMIHHDTMILKDVILENLWPDYERSKALPILQTSVCKIRNLFSAYRREIKLSYADNKYGLLVQNVRSEYIEVEKALRDFDRNKPASFSAVRAAGSFCRKGLLSQNGYLWAEGRNEELRWKVRSALKEISDELMKNGETEKGLVAFADLAMFSPEDEGLQAQYLQHLISRNHKDEAIRYSRWLDETLCRDFDENLPEKIAEMIEKIKKQSN